MAAMTAMCRVSIRSETREADVELPADMPVGKLLPEIVDLLGGDSDAGSLRLARPDGTVLDVAAALGDCGVHDGSVLFVIHPDLAAPPPFLDVCATVARASQDRGRPSPESVSTVLFVLWSAITMSVVISLGSGRSGYCIVSLCLTALLALAAAIRLRDRQIVSSAFGVIAAAVAAAAAWFTVPGVSGFLLASSALAGVALIGWRALDHSGPVLLSLSGVGLASATMSAAVVSEWLPAPAAGPLLATGAVTVLALSPRWVARAGGLTPSAPAPDLTTVTTSAQRRLTGLVVASAGTALLGAALSAVWADEAGGAAFFTGVTSLVLLLRSRIQRSTTESWAVRVAAAGAATVCAAQLTIIVPGTAGWLCAVIAAAALAAVVLGPTTVLLSATASRAVAVLDVAAGAAMVPAACAAAGVYPELGGLL